MPGFVPDASATLPWRFEDEATPWTDELADLPGSHAPAPACDQESIGDLKRPVGGHAYFFPTWSTKLLLET